jgi:membrane-associated phospholipid phosphatase
VRNRWLLLVAALVGYVLLWVGWVAQWAWLRYVDVSLLASAHRYGVAHPGWVRGWQLFCDVFGPWTFQLAAVVIAIVALVRSKRWVAVFLLVCVVLAGTVTEIAKDIAQRSRPISALVHEPSWSFPSGHALGTITGLLGLTAAALVLVTPVRRRSVWIAAAIGAVVVLLIGIGRVLLNVHNPSDVLAGWLLGGVWFLATLPILSGGRTREVQIVSKP